MNIAFFSYEYPEETGGGGIGTYLKLVTSLLRRKGHTPVVFAGTSKDISYWENEFVFRIPANGWRDFNEKLPAHFLPVHQEMAFEVAECTDFNACGYTVKKRVPGLPVVVRLHTPLYLIDRLQHLPLSSFEKCRLALGAIRRLRWPVLPKAPARNDYADEFHLINIAERIGSPGNSIVQKMNLLGFQLEGKTDSFPLPFEISPAVRQIQPRASISSDPHIVFIGRLELRKGVVELARCIPGILRRWPGAKFTFVGADAEGLLRGRSMRECLLHELANHSSAVSFTGPLPHAEMLWYFAAGDVFAFPSHFESFGLACCEAMAAGKSVIGSHGTGLAEIIEDGSSGLLSHPKNQDDLQSCIARLLEDDNLRLTLGANARKRIDSFLDGDRIAAMQLACYQAAIDQVKSAEGNRPDHS